MFLIYGSTSQHRDNLNEDGLQVAHDLSELLCGVASDVEKRVIVSLDVGDIDFGAFAVRAFVALSDASITWSPRSSTVPSMSS